MQDKMLQIKTAVQATLFVLLCVAGVLESYAYEFTEGDLVYSVNENANATVTVKGHKDGTSATGTLTIPFELYHEGNYYTVTRIDNWAFDNCSGLTGNLFIPNTVTHIGMSAFEGCSGLTGNLVIPNAVTYIARWAFYRCSGFSGGSLTIPSSVQYIGEYAFYNCGFTTINYDATDCNVSITNYYNPSSPDAQPPFDGNQATIHIGSSVERIPNNLFYQCSTLTGSIIIPNSVTSIGSKAFYACSGLTGITIPNSIISIGDEAFKYCSSLTGTLTIPNSVTSIGNNAFYRCTGFDQIIVESGNTVYDSRGNCNAIILTSTSELMLGCKNTVIPTTITSIGASAFEYCSGLTSISIPNSVTSIGSSAFGNCRGLTSLTISNSVTTIGGCAFEWCGLSGDLIIPQSVTSIGFRAFYCCSGLFSSSIIMLANTPPSLGSQAFDGIAYSYYSVKIYVPYESLNAYETGYSGTSYSIDIRPMAYKTIAGYSTGNDKWAFIASPLAEDNLAPTAIENMIPSNDSYDLYRFNQSAELEWENWKSHANNDDHYHFNLENGQGYLYANAEDVNLIFRGTFNENKTKDVELVYDEGKPHAGWNLVGNPFPYAAIVDKSYYVMNAEGTGVEPTALSEGTSIEACTGIMVKATATGQTATFTKPSRTTTDSNGLIQIAVATSTGQVADKAIVSFNEGDELGKFHFGEQNANIYISQGNEDYAIATSKGQGEVPVNFKAKENGQYTISVNPKNVEMNYLHLIDNMTGADIDLLQTPNYTFEAKTTDYASRFRLLFATNGIEENNIENATFAFFANGNLIVNNVGEAFLQIFDMLGHQLDCRQVHSTFSIPDSAFAPGMYMIRLINGENTKVQKIVVQ